MKVFISWSGERSRAVAEVLREWLPNVIQVITPWVSLADIEKGARWSTDIAVQLEECRVGLICLTPENLSAPWLLFEVGALSKTLDKTFVCPYLLNLHPTDIQGPLSQFQLTMAEKEETRKLLHTINKALGDYALQAPQVNAAFEKWWAELDSRLKTISSIQLSAPPRRSDRELLEEVLENVRAFACGRASATLVSESWPAYIPPPGRRWPVSINRFSRFSWDLSCCCSHSLYGNFPNGTLLHGVVSSTTKIWSRSRATRGP